MLTLSILLVPIIALVLTVMVGKSILVSRRIALVSVSVQLLLVMASLVRFPSYEHFRIQSDEGITASMAPVEQFSLQTQAIRTEEVAWPFSFFIGLDAISLPLLVLITVAFGTVLFYMRGGSNRLRRYYLLLLLLNACSIGVLVAQEGLYFLLCFGGVVTAAVAAVGICRKENDEKGHLKVSNAIRRFLPVGWIAVMVLGVVVLSSASDTGQVDVQRIQGTGESKTFELPTLTARAARDFRREVFPLQKANQTDNGSVRSILFVLLLAAFCTLMVVVPFHFWTVELLDLSLPSIAALLSVLFPMLGLYALIRFPLFLFPELSTDQLWREILAGVGGLSAIYGAAVALGMREPDRGVRYIAVGWSGLTLLLLVSLAHVWVEAAIAGFILSSLCILLLSGLIQWLRNSLDAENLGDVRGLFRVAPRLAGLCAIPLLALALLPLVLGGFILLKNSGAHAHPGLDNISGEPGVGWIILSVVCGVMLVGGVLRIGGRLLFGEPGIALRAESIADISTRTWLLGFGGAIGAIVLGGAAVYQCGGVAGEMIQSILIRTFTIPT